MGTRASLKITSRVAEALMPSLFSFLPNSRPGVSLSTMNALAPRAPLALSVSAMTV